jgi:NAD(P)-dependent dehydrogenase (short-subunit alcohol dehydrogenase family)
MVKILITGATRGLGLALTEYFLKKKCSVLALCRNRDIPKKLDQLKCDYRYDLNFIFCDLSDLSQIDNIHSQAVKFSDKIDIVINNAGVLFKDESIRRGLKDNFLESMQVNAMAPFMILQALLPLLERSSDPKVLNISSLSGITSRIKSFNGLYSYKISKASLNMMTKLLALELKDVIIVCVDPGKVQTDMGSPDADITAEESAAGIFDLAANLKIENSASFFNYNGNKLDW